MYFLYHTFRIILEGSSDYENEISLQNSVSSSSNSSCLHLLRTNLLIAALRLVLINLLFFHQSSSRLPHSSSIIEHSLAVGSDI